MLVFDVFLVSVPVFVSVYFVFLGFLENCTRETSKTNI